MTRRRRLLALVALLALVLAAAACGDDDDSTDATTDTTEATDATGGDDAEDALPSVDVTMRDYAYQVSGDLVAGGTINLSNAGKEFHMLGIGKLKDGKTLDDLRDAMSKPPANEEDDPTAAVLDELGAPGSIMTPGAAVSITIPDLGAGDYALICFIPTEGPEGQPHFSKGMIGELDIVEGDAPAPPKADASYTIAAGKAVAGPAELTAGRRVLELKSEGDTSALEPILLKPDPGKTFADVEKVFDSFEETLPENAASKVPGKLLLGLFDLGQFKTVYLGADFEAGTYELVAPDTDGDNAPAVPTERIAITVK